MLAPKKNFIKAKVDFIEEMLKLSEFQAPSESLKILDVGCGIGGTSRYLGKKFGPNASVTGITLSTVQAKRATDLATAQSIRNVNFEIMDALDMKFPDNTFDLVWGCESGEHMPDKKKYIEEMARVLKPGGKVVVATWCQRDDKKIPFNAQV
jgi:MPBQ/MSBQ methyltransferase